MLRRRDILRAFTLLEICLALMIGLLLVTLAVPAISGVLAEQRLKESFGRFDHLAAEAKRRSVEEQRAWHLVWDKNAIVLLPLGQGDGKGQAATVEKLATGRDESFELQRPAVLQTKAPPEWVFWPNGTCEPAVIAYSGHAGTWEARYNALTGHGIFTSSETR
jgi:Tfp pilus assembly protein FimT